MRISHRTDLGFHHQGKPKMKKEIICVEPLASLLEKYKASTSTVVKHGDTLYVMVAPPYDKN
jgi:hypothetical protein